MSEKRRLSSTNRVGQGVVIDSKIHPTLFERLRDIHNFDGVLPLTRNARFFSEHLNIVGLHDLAYMDIDAFTAITNDKIFESEGKLKSFWPGKGQRWQASFQLIGFSKKAAEKVMQTSVIYHSTIWICAQALRDETPVPENPNAIIDIVKRLCSGEMNAFSELRRFHMYVQNQGDDHWKSTRQRVLLPSTSIIDLVSPKKEEPKKVGISGDQDLSKTGSSSSSSSSSCAIDSQCKDDEIVPTSWKDLQLPELALNSPPTNEEAQEMIRILNETVADINKKYESLKERNEKSCLDVSEILSRARGSHSLLPEEEEKLSFLLSSIKQTNIIDGLQSIKLGNETYFSLSRFRGKKHKTGQRQARILSILLEKMGITEHGLSLFLRRHVSEVKKSAPVSMH